MIEFAYLIHKPTETIIGYNKWLEFLDKGEIELFINNSKQYTEELNTFRYRYTPKDMLLSDDFKILYKHDLTFNELREVYNALRIQTIYESSLAEKVEKLIKERYNNEIRYYLDEN